MIHSSFVDATLEMVDQTLQSANSCFLEFSKKKAKERAHFLDCIADHLEKQQPVVIEIAEQETKLGLVRLAGECARTIQQIRLFADLARNEDWRELSFEKGEPHRVPLPKPEMWKENQPIGPVVVLGACNFPLAISVVGTDTASALAVGCPVVVKSHPGHAQTCQFLADLVNVAKEESNMPDGCFSLLHGENHEISAAMVSHPKTACVAFTGSFVGGKALSQISKSRTKPIPFHAEMGSVNPVFGLPSAIKEKGESLINSYVGAVNLFCGQMCTKPGAFIILKDSFDEIFLARLQEAVSNQKNLPMLNTDVHQNFERSSNFLRRELELLAESGDAIDGQIGNIQIYKASAQDFLNRSDLRTESFGPASLLIIARTDLEMIEIAKAMEGNLTGSMLVGSRDQKLASILFPILESKVGRILWNGFPPGVTPGLATHHGGPWPATTDARFTSIGLHGYKRFVRPICKEGFPNLRGVT